MALKYKFTDWKGEKRVEVEKPYDMLNDISNCSSAHLNESIINLQKVINGELDYWSWGGTDFCTIDTAELESMIFYEFGEKDTVIDTKELLKLITEYKEIRKK